MRKYGRLKQGMKRAVALVAVLSLGATACAGNDNPQAHDEREQVTLKLATTQVETALENRSLWNFVERLEQEAPWIEIDYVGGPDVVDPSVAAENVQSGAFDLASVCTCYYTQVMPEAGALDLTASSPANDRQNGAFDLVSRWHEEHGLHLLGSTYDRVSFYMHFGDEYAALDLDDVDLSGWLLRAPPTIHPAVHALGGQAVSMPVSETYTAMDRGTIDGFVLANVGMYELGLADAVVASVEADLGFVRYPLLMNPDTWEQLDNETQAALDSAIQETEEEQEDLFENMIQEEFERMDSDGKLLLKPANAARQELENTALDGMWSAILERAPRAQELRDIYEEERRND